MNQIVILGHSGFIGSSLKSYFEDKTEIKIAGHSYPEIDLKKIDSVEKLEKYFHPNVTVILVAAVKRQFGDTLDTFYENIQITKNICHLLEKKPINRLIFFSSTAVYGEETENNNINEKTAINLTSYYGISKYTSERLLKKSFSAGNIKSLVCLRPPLIYGEGDTANTYGPSSFVNSAILGQSITLWGDGSELREFIYINDLCYLIDCLLESKFYGDLNVVSGVSYSFSEIIQLLETKYSDLVVNSKSRSKNKADNVFDATKVKAILPNNFEFTSLNNGLAKLISYHTSLHGN